MLNWFQTGSRKHTANKSPGGFVEQSKASWISLFYLILANTSFMQIYFIFIYFETLFLLHIYIYIYNDLFGELIS